MKSAYICISLPKTNVWTEKQSQQQQQNRAKIYTSHANSVSVYKHRKAKKREKCRTTQTITRTYHWHTYLLSLSSTRTKREESPHLYTSIHTRKNCVWESLALPCTLLWFSSFVVRDVWWEMMCFFSSFIISIYTCVCVKRNKHSYPY